MDEVQHVLKVALRAGERVFMHAKGDPATVLACGMAAGIVVVATTVGYGSYFYSRKLLDWVRSS